MSTKKTKEKILLSACELFAKKGFDNVTHRELSQYADINAALINYHFGSKRKLYDKVLDYAYAINREEHPINFDESDSAECKIIKFVNSRVNAVLDDGPGGWFLKLTHYEMSASGSQSVTFYNKYLRPMRESFTPIISKFLGVSESDFIVEITFFNIASHWILLNIVRSQEKCFFDNGKLSEAESAELKEEILKYVMGGLHSTKKA